MDEDPFAFELIFHDVPLVGLMDAAREMEGVVFLHGHAQRTRTFSFETIEPALHVCLAWAETDGPEDARDALGVQQLAAVRAWTCTPLCYVYNSAMRSKDRTVRSVKPVLYYGHLFFTGLHALPEQYILRDVTLFRAEHGVMEGWDTKMRAGSFSFFVPTSFSKDPAVVKDFKGVGDRTVFLVHGASGYMLGAFSPYPEDEVLLEPICYYEVLKAEKFDATHRDVLMGEVREGLHRVEGRTRPGVALLEGSRVKASEAESWQAWQAEHRSDTPFQLLQLQDLEFDPLSDEEWLARGKEKPKTTSQKRLSKLGGGAFGMTYRKRVKGAKPGHAATRFAVKVFSVEKFEDLDIREGDVRREAATLGMLRHKHVIRYFGLVETDDEMALVMELAQGGSLAGLIQARAPSAGVDTEALYKIMSQMAAALDYIHGQGIVHRDVKADNILLAHAEGGGPVCVKLADFGVSAVLATGARSALLSSAGTKPYFAPERGYDLAFGGKADVWALGCVLIELVTLQRLTRGLWHEGPEASGRRGQLLERVSGRDVALGKIAQQLLRMDKTDRLSALALKAALGDASPSAPPQPPPSPKSPSMPARPEPVPAVLPPAAGAFDHLFDLTSLTTKLGKPDGVHDTLSVVCDSAVGAPAQVADELLDLRHFLGRHLPVLKVPPVDLGHTLLQLMSQEPAASRVRRAAEAALHKAHEGSRRLIEWTNKWQLPCVMDIREHSGAVLAVTVSPDGKLIALGSEDNTMVVVEAATGRVRCRLRGHRCDACCVRVAYTWRDFSARLRRCCSGSARTWSLATDQCLPAAL